MQATYTFAARYYTEEVHEKLKDFLEDVSFSSVRFDTEITHAMMLDTFIYDEDQSMMEIEFEEFERKEHQLNELLVAAKIPFERMYYAYDGYDGKRSVFYPDGTSHDEYLDADDKAVIPASAFNEFFMKGPVPFVNTMKLTADNFKRVIDENTLRFKRGAEYFVENEYIFLEKEERESIEDILAKYDDGKLTQDEAFKKIAEIKKKEAEEIEELFGND